MNFRILSRIVLTAGLPVSLLSLPGVELPIALAVYFTSFIWRGSERVHFLLYLEHVSACYSRLPFVILTTHGS